MADKPTYSPRTGNSISKVDYRGAFEKMARLHLAALGVGLTELGAEQAEYLGIPIEGPYKSDRYRY